MNVAILKFSKFQGIKKQKWFGKLFPMVKVHLNFLINAVDLKEVHESAIFDHCARPSSLVNR